MESHVSKNIWYASIGNILLAFLTYVFWFVTARLVGPEIIGTTSAIISFVLIIVTIDLLNMSLGMKRYLGRAYSSGDNNTFKQIITATVVTSSIVVSASIVIIAIPNLQVLEIIGIDREHLWIILAMIPAMVFQGVFSEALVAALKSKDLVWPIVIGSLLRFPALFIAIYVFSAPTTGTIISYSIVVFVSATLYAIMTARIFRGTTVRATHGFLKNTKLVLNASFASWLPQMISTLGSQLGILSVFSIAGASAGGQFYIPMAIYFATLFIVSGINRVSHPLIAGMQTNEQQIEHLYYSVKIAFIATLPIGSALLFFAPDFLAILGTEFKEGSMTLMILMVSLPLAIISEIVYYFAYGRGNLKTVLYFGLAGNLPRTLLYLTLVPTLGPTGAAIAYVVGTISQLVVSIVYARRNNFLKLDFKSYLILAAVPLVIGLITFWVNLHFLIATPIIFFGSYLLFTKIHLLTEKDVLRVAYAILPNATAKRVHPFLSKLMARID